MIRGMVITLLLSWALVLGWWALWSLGSSESDAVEGLGEGLVWAIGWSVIVLGLLPAACQTVVITDRGVALRRWGRTAWWVGWDSMTGWHREVDQRGTPMAVVIHPRRGTARRIGFGWIALSETAHEPLLAAIKRHTPQVDELPQVTFIRPAGVHCCLAIVFPFLLGLLLWAIYSTTR